MSEFTVVTFRRPQGTRFSSSEKLLAKRSFDRLLDETLDRFPKFTECKEKKDKGWLTRRVWLLGTSGKNRGYEMSLDRIVRGERPQDQFSALAIYRAAGSGVLHKVCEYDSGEKDVADRVRRIDMPVALGTARPGLKDPRNLKQRVIDMLENHAMEEQMGLNGGPVGVEEMVCLRKFLDDVRPRRYRA